MPSLALPAAPEPGSGEAEADPAGLEAVARAEAVQLFVERASSTLPSFALDRSNVRAVVEICRRLDGIPLALELAAARVNVLSADEIAQGLGDRFRLLTGGRRTAAPRQRTLQAAIDWSWDLLDEADRRLLRRLSVFSGSWTLGAAAVVTSQGGAHASGGEGAARLETLDRLSRLVDRSLVVVDHAGATRYRMLETIRQYAADQLAASGETVALRDRHLALFRELALDAEQGLEGPEMAASMARLDADIDNLRAALEWAFETHPEAALEMCVAMISYWGSRAMGSEGVDRMLQAVDLARRWRTTAATPSDTERSVLAARVMARAALLRASYTGRAAASSLEDEATAIARASGDPAAIADTLVTLAFSHVAVDGSLPPGETAEEALNVAEELGDWYRASIIEAGLAMHEAAVDLASAEGWLERATEAARRSGNPWAIGNVAGIRGRVASHAGRLPEAQRWFREAQTQFRAYGDRRFERVIESELAHALRRAGQIDEAEAQYRQTIRAWQQSGNRGAVANQLESFAFLALVRGRGVRAARLLGAAEALREVAEAPMTALEHGGYDADVQRLRDLLEAGAFSDAWAEGRRMTADEAVAVSLSE